MKDLFKTPDIAIGKQLKIKGKSYTIIGVTKEQGSLWKRAITRQMFIPFNSFKKFIKWEGKGLMLFKS